MQAARGSFVVLEGLDRAGKSTLALKLASLLRNSKYYKFPDRSTESGITIDQYLNRKIELKDQEIHSLFTKNRWELHDQMKETILNGTTLIVDRYCYSGAAYSSAKMGMDLNKCLKPEEGLIMPDLVIFLTVSSNEQKRRQGFGDERYEDGKFQAKVREKFEEIFKKFPPNSILNVNVDGKTPDQLLEEVKDTVEKCLENSRHVPLGEIRF